MYGLPGWVAHTVTNAWGYSAPGQGAGWGLHVSGGAWIALQLWEHYEFGQDAEYPAREGLPCPARSGGILPRLPVPSPGAGLACRPGRRTHQKIGTSPQQVISARPPWETPATG